MKASEIMTREVATVAPTTPVREIAVIMAQKRVSGLPVVSAEGQILGIVSESDLLHRAELGTDQLPRSWLRVFADSDQLAREYTRTHGLKAHDVMSRHVVSVKDDAELQRVADVLDKHKIKRVPVVRDGKLVGIITRGDLVRALSTLHTQAAAKQLDDGALQSTLLEKIRKQPWLDASYVNVMVKDGAVELWGIVESEDKRRALRILVEEEPGVKNVADRLGIGRPYTTLY